MSRKTLTRRALMGAAAATAFAPYVKRAYAAGPIRVISHRQPALEYYTDQMKKALPEGQVSVELMPIDKEVELASITMSARLRRNRCRLSERYHNAEIRRQRLAGAAG